MNKPNNKKIIEEKIKGALEKHKEILFAYIHGSFVEGDDFHDVDMAIYLESEPASVLEYELQMETELRKEVGKYIFDVRVLNTAPLSFKYNVIKNGTILLCRNKDKRSNFQESTVSAYLDFLPYRNIYLQETIGIEI